jgi:hypothetical protein
MARDAAFPEPVPRKKRWVFGIGLGILLVAWVISLNPYLLLLAGPFYLLGASVVWASRVSRAVKMATTGLPILAWIPAVYILMLVAEAQAVPETYLIPQRFRGTITVLYNEPCGQVIPTEKGRLIYRIPASGVLAVQHPYRAGVIKQNYYFVDAQGRRMQKISQLLSQDDNEDHALGKNPQKSSKQEIGIFLSGAGSGDNFENQSFTFSQLDVNSWEGLKATNIPAHNMLVDSILKACRKRH